MFICSYEIIGLNLCFVLWAEHVNYLCRLKDAHAIETKLSYRYNKETIANLAKSPQKFFDLSWLLSTLHAPWYSDAPNSLPSHLRSLWFIIPVVPHFLVLSHIYPLILWHLLILQRGRNCLSPACYPCPYFAPCFSTACTLLLGSQPSGTCHFAVEITASLHAVYCFGRTLLYQKYV